MTDEQYTFEHTRVRLEGILVEVRKKDTSLEQSLELLEEGVRLLNQCNELIDQTAWRPAVAAGDDAGDAGSVPAADGTGDAVPADGGPEAVAAGGDEPADEQPGSHETLAEGQPGAAEDGVEVEDDERD